MCLPAITPGEENWKSAGKILRLSRTFQEERFCSGEIMTCSGTRKKTKYLNEEYRDRLFFLQNNFAVYKDYALVGTKGFTFEGPFYLNRRGEIIGWDEEKEAHARKLVARETERLRDSFDQAEKAGFCKFIMFLHYPPTSILEETSPFTEIAKEYGAEAVVYSHCHGESRFGDSIRGDFQGIRYMLVSGDYLNFRPALVME